MFDVPPTEAPNPEVCHLTLTAFPLAFQELGKLQTEDPVLANIIAKLERGECPELFFVQGHLVLPCQ